VPAVCMYFEAHQPWRLRTMSPSASPERGYFDYPDNAAILNKVASKCYVPTNRALKRLVERHDGRFRIAFAMTGTLIEQMRHWSRETLQSFEELIATGSVELVGETDYHSLAALFDPGDFRAQVELHMARMESLFGQRPTVFRNTELIYNEQIGEMVEAMGFKAMLAEGADDVLAGRSPNFVYHRPGGALRLLLKNYRLSDDIAFRFSNRAWADYPLTADKFASWVHGMAGDGEVVNLFMDYETFGEHQWADSGIFDFLDHLPSEILRHEDFEFLTPSQVVERYEPVGEMAFPRTVSWADEARDLSAWQGNRLQRSALKRCYALGPEVRRRNNPTTTEIWRRLQTSDHFYYMSTKGFADGDVHAYFSPYPGPYDAFLNYMHALHDFTTRVLGLPEPEPEHT